MNVLLGLGGTDESMRALTQTVERARAVGDDLTIAILDKPEAKRSQVEMREETERVLAETGFSAEIVVVDGDPGSNLVELAERGEFDQLVIAGGTESPMGKIRVGPIAEFVLLNATMTVKLVR